MNNINLKVKNELTNRNVINDLKEIKNNEVNSILLSLLIKYSNCLKEIYHENHGNLELNEKNIQRLQLIENRLFQITRSSAEVILIQETLIEIRRVISQSITKPVKIQLTFLYFYNLYFYNLLYCYRIRYNYFKQKKKN